MFCSLVMQRKFVKKPTCTLKSVVYLLQRDECNSLGVGSTISFNYCLLITSPALNIKDALAVLLTIL